MKSRSISALLCCAFLSVPALPVSARDAARDLRRMVGYTIVAAAAVQETKQGRIGETIIVLDTGAAFQVTGVLLPPLPLTDVIVFAKPPTAEIIAKYGDKLPKEQLMSYRLLIDNEAHDVIRVR
jgi:hypothetical protein